MTEIVPSHIEDYAAGHSSPPPDHLVALWEETHRELDAPGMLTGPVEGRLLEMLVFALGARRVLEIGTYSGYSALSMAAGMPTGGRIVSCEIEPRHAEFARRHIAASPYASMIEVKVGLALESLRTVEGPFDFVFIDADKEHYPDYYEAVLPLLAPRGLIAADNTLWSGRVLDAADAEASTQSLRTFNDLVAQDPRVVAVMLTVRDGLTLIRRNG